MWVLFASSVDGDLDDAKGFWQPIAFPVYFFECISYVFVCFPPIYIFIFLLSPSPLNKTQTRGHKAASSPPSP